MLNRYNHPDENDGFERVMLALGYNVNAANKEDIQKREKLLEQIQPKKCPFCEMVNVKEARFCTDCKMPLDPMADMERRQESENLKKRLEEVEKNQAAAIETATRLQRIEDWFSKDVPKEIEMLIGEYMEPDPEDGSLPANKEEFEKRHRDLPELMLVLNKLRARRRAAAADQQQQEQKELQ